MGWDQCCWRLCGWGSRFERIALSSRSLFSFLSSLFLPTALTLFSPFLLRPAYLSQLVVEY
jgi:hypothetical protein